MASVQKRDEYTGLSRCTSGAVTRPVSSQCPGVDPESLTWFHFFLIIVGASQHSGDCPAKRMIEQQQHQLGWCSDSNRVPLLIKGELNLEIHFKPNIPLNVQLNSGLFAVSFF